MKALLTNLYFILFLGIVLLPSRASAQPDQLGNANGTFLCPNKQYNLSSSTTPSSNSCSVNWTVTNGMTLLQNPTTAGLMQIMLNDIPGGMAIVRTAYTNCSNTTANGNSPPLTIYIRSITNVALGAITLNNSTSGNLDFGSTAQVALEVPLLTIPRNASDPNSNATISASGYEWTIPAGWTWPDGSISNGTPRLFTFPAVNVPNRVVVTPPAAACAGGAVPVVKVRAVDTECSIGAQASYVPTKSAEKTLTINCVTPPLLIVTNATPQGGPVSLFCGQNLDGLRASSTATGFSNFNFTGSGVVSVSGGQGTGVPNPTISGPGTGTIGLTANYIRNGASTTVTATPVTVTVQATVAPITLQPIPASCPGQTIRLTAASVPGATAYAWAVPYPFNPQGTTVTTQPYLDITSDATALNRAFMVRVEARSGSCTPSYSDGRGILGTGSGISIGVDASHSQTEICPYTSLTLQANIDDNQFRASTTYAYNWTISKRNGRTGATTTTTDAAQTIFVTTPGAGDWLDVQVRVTSSCGDFSPASQSWQSVTQFSTGEYCLESYSLAARPAPAYPNPANERLHLPPAHGTYVLYDSHGQAVRQQRATAAAGELNTQKLPAGLYYLVRLDGQNPRCGKPFACSTRRAQPAACTSPDFHRKPGLFLHFYLERGRGSGHLK